MVGSNHFIKVTSSQNTWLWIPVYTKMLWCAQNIPRAIYYFSVIPEISGKFSFLTILWNFRKLPDKKNFWKFPAKISRKILPNFLSEVVNVKKFGKLDKKCSAFFQKFLERLKINFQKKGKYFYKKEKLFLETPTGQNFPIFTTGCEMTFPEVSCFLS